ncbi:unnamed protein product [Rhizoctonia solani]|uniref:Uncharacterized protein n=1 Tax=Rhizoctonia solani TaxID=456999 RepID=A0A8H3DIV9_9AGAM|nr:unnamed protein product [Rhizoctonia solani]
MGRVKPRFHALLVSVTIACLLISPTAFALPSQERKSDEILFEPLDLPPDILTKAPLMYRALGERGSARARYLRQVEAAAVFEASRLAAKVQRERESQEHQSTDLGESTPTGERRHIQSDDGNFNDLDTAAPLNGPILPEGSSEKRVHSRDHHHHHQSDDHSQGGHSEHWFEHHGLKPASRHRNHRYHHHHSHHHHTRQRVKGFDRLVQVRSPRIGDHSAPVNAPDYEKQMQQGLSEVEDGDGASPHGRPSGMKERIGQEVGSSDGQDNWDTSSRPRQAGKLGSDKRGVSKDEDHSENGISGIIDLMQGSPDGQKLAGLSVSSLPPNDTTSFISSDVLKLLIDSTTNLVDQATFFLHTFDDQSTLAHETPAPRTTRDLLVSLEVPHAPGNSLPQRMCATFDPLEMDIQVFGLALCMDQDSATNNRRMSQAFRYSPGTGVLTPFYGAEGARGSVLAAVNERIQSMDLNEDEQLSSVTGWNGTGIYDLDPNVPALSPNWSTSATSSFDFGSAAALEGGNPAHKSSPELGLFSVSHTSGGTLEMISGSQTVAAVAPMPTPLLSVNDTSADHPLVIGGPTGKTASTASEDTSSHVIMVFRSNMESDSWCRTKQDQDTPVERQKALESYQEIGLASKNATELDHWAVIDKIRSNGSNRPGPKANSSGARANTTAFVMTSSAGDGIREGVPNEDDVVAADLNEDDEGPPPKPVLNVAYFGNSGRSAPVPPDQQADFARPLLVADPLVKPHTAPKLAAADPNDLGGSTAYHAHVGQNPAPEVMAAVSKSRIGPLGIPIDESD